MLQINTARTSNYHFVEELDQTLYCIYEIHILTKVRSRKVYGREYNEEHKWKLLAVLYNLLHSSLLIYFSPLSSSFTCLLSPSSLIAATDRVWPMTKSTEGTGYPYSKSLFAFEILFLFQDPFLIFISNYI